MKYSRGYLTPEEISSIIQGWHNEKHRLLMRTLWRTGSRISEIVGMRQADSIDKKDHRDIGLVPNRIYPDENRLLLYTIKRTKRCDNEEKKQDIIDTMKSYWGVKTEEEVRDKIKEDSNMNNKGEIRTYDFSDRLVTVPRALVTDLLSFVDCKNIEGDELIFDISRNWAFEVVKRAALKAEVEPDSPAENGIHPHHFRHSFCVNYVKKKSVKDLSDLSALQRAVNHKDMTTTAHYLQFSGDLTEEDMKTLWE